MGSRGIPRDEPTNLPEGTEVELLAADEMDELDPAERAKLYGFLAESIRPHVPGTQALDFTHTRSGTPPLALGESEPGNEYLGRARRLCETAKWKDCSDSSLERNLEARVARHPQK